MPASSSASRSGVLEKPGRRDSGSPRPSITRSTPAFRNAARNSGTVAPSYPMVKMRVIDRSIAGAGNVDAGAFESFPERLQGMDVRARRAHQAPGGRLADLDRAQGGHDAVALEIREAVRIPVEVGIGQQ